MTDHTSVVHTKNDVELSENLLDPFTKTLTRKVFVGHKGYPGVEMLAMK